MLYLTQVDSGYDATLRLINDSDFPVHKSSQGMVLCHKQGKREALRILKASIHMAEDTAARAATIYKNTDRNLKANGFLYLPHQPRNKFNSALPFSLDGEDAALAIYSRAKNATTKQLRTSLQGGAERIIAQFYAAGGKRQTSRV